MTGPSLLAELQANASATHKASVVRMGIPEENSLGVSTAVIRRLAKKVGKSASAAFDLWESGCHEARLLAVLLFPPKDVTTEDIQRMMSDVVSWDLCDHLCKALILPWGDYQHLIPLWIVSPHTYEKRAAFTLMASAAIHDQTLSDDVLDQYLMWIRQHSQDDRVHVKKAVSWALREIGKRDFVYNEKALLLAHELKETGSKTQVWIAKDAIKELENLVQSEGRRRLISRSTQMGKDAEKP